MGVTSRTSSGSGTSKGHEGFTITTVGAAEGGLGFRASSSRSSSVSRESKSAGVSTVTKSSYSSGGSAGPKRGSLSPSKDKKSISTMAAALTDVFDGPLLV